VIKKQNILKANNIKYTFQYVQRYSSMKRILNAWARIYKSIHMGIWLSFVSYWMTCVVSVLKSDPLHTYRESGILSNGYGINYLASTITHPSSPHHSFGNAQKKRRAIRRKTS